MTKLEVWVEGSAAWRELKLNAAGEPVYVSNGSKVGAGLRITRVSDSPVAPPPPPSDPLPGDPENLEFKVMPNGTIEAVQARLIPHPYPQTGVFPRMYDMVVGGVTYTFDPETQSAFVFTSGPYTITIGFWGFVQVDYDTADAAQLPADGVTVPILTITSHRWSAENGTRISAAKPPKTISITGRALSIDTKAPTVLSISPSGTGVPLGSSLIITCDEPVQAGAGNFYIYDKTGSVVLETIAAASALYLGNQITLTPTLTQQYSNDYSIRWDLGTFTDRAMSPNAVAANSTDAYSWTSEAAPVSSGGIWYDEVFTYRDGVGVGPRVSSWTPAATWAAATPGVSNNGTQITVSGSGITATAIDFTGFRLVNSGANNIFEDCIGDVNANGAGGAGRQWSIGGLNPTVRYCRIINSTPRGGVNELGLHDATGIISVYNNDLRDAAGQDPIKGPTNNSAIMTISDVLLKGTHLTPNAHIDMFDMRKAGPGSSIRRSIVICDKTATSVPSSTGTGVNNAIRQNPGDFSPAFVATDYTFEELILVGHDDPLAQATFLAIGNQASTGIVFYDILVDLRYHRNLAFSTMRVEDWYVRPFDYAASVAAGQITGIGAPIAFPNLANQPATVPSTMEAPIISPIPGGLQWAANKRPWNQRSLITRYDLRWSTDGINWTTVSDVSLDASSIQVAAASNYRIQFRAVNGVGAGAWSASSNLVTVAAPSGTHRIMVVYGQSEVEHILLSSADQGTPKPALLADNRVKFVYHNPNASDPRPVVSKWLVSSDPSLTGPMKAFANMLISLGGPLDTYEVGWITYTGLGWSALFNDGSPKLPFSAAQEIAAALSGVPTLQYQSWLSANRNLDTAYAPAFENLWLGNANGVAISAPYFVKNKFGAAASPGYNVTHLMPELFDPAVSIPVLGQHKFDVRQDNDTYNTVTGGAPGSDFTSNNIHNNRVSIDTFFAGANTGPSRRGMELCSYLNGYPNGTGWADIPHPSSKNVDGMQRFAYYLAYAMAEAYGLTAAQPEIDSVTWAPDKVNVSSSAGAITNVFAHRGESQLNPATFAHYTEVMGFYINGQPAERVEFDGTGGINIYYGDGTQNFINTDTIMFAPGGAGASLKYPEDMQNSVWKAFPCVDTGVPFLGLMNLRPMVNFSTLFPNDLVNTTR